MSPPDIDPYAAAIELSARKGPAVQENLSASDRQRALDMARELSEYDLSLSRNVGEWRELLTLLEGEPKCGMRVDYDDGVMCTYGPCVLPRDHSGVCEPR